MAGDACPGGSVLLDVRSQAERTIGAKRSPGVGQALKDSDGNIALKTIEGPFLSKFNSGGGTSLLPARKGIRYFVHSWWIACRDDGSHATTSLDLRGTLGGATQLFGKINFVPSVAGVGSGQGIADILFDANTAITSVIDVTPTSATVGFTYCEIMEAP